jgi:hypothetical protein
MKDAATRRPDLLALSKAGNAACQPGYFFPTADACESPL